MVKPFKLCPYFFFLVVILELLAQIGQTIELKFNNSLKIIRNEPLAVTLMVRELGESVSTYLKNDLLTNFIFAQ